MAMAAATFLILLLAAPAVYAVDHVVGGTNPGWDTTINYATWASGTTFTVGDNLLFSYTSTHSVDQVSQSDYTNCNGGNPINRYTGGQNTVPLPTAGPIYFLCPTPGHCGQGMRLAIIVVANTTTGGSPPTASPSPPGTETPPTTPNNTPNETTSPPPPSGSGAASGRMMIGLSLVFAPVIALMV